jgi:hypothetical protein
LCRERAGMTLAVWKRRFSPFEIGDVIPFIPRG